MKRSAGFSRCKHYRYWLKREWDSELPTCAFICLNPSTADASTDDPTLRRITHFATDWGYGSVWVVNLFAFRSTDPTGLMHIEDPVGARNNYWLRKITKEAELAVAAWGNLGRYLERDKWMVRHRADLHCLGITKSSMPKHPLYCPQNAIPTLYRS